MIIIIKARTIIIELLNFAHPYFEFFFPDFVECDSTRLLVLTSRPPVGNPVARPSPRIERDRRTGSNCALGTTRMSQSSQVV